MIDIKQLRQAIIKRTSVRTFNGESLKPEHQELLINYLDTKENLVGVFGTEIKVQMLIPTDDEFKSVATYGTIKHAPIYLAICCKKTWESMVDCGFIIENLVLFLTSLGIGSCWLGGTFKRQQLSLVTELEKDEFIPILLPIGYENLAKSFTDKAIRAIAKSHSREPFDSRFFMNTFEERIVDQELVDQLDFVKVAPSASNKQPWRLVVTEGHVDFYLVRTANYGLDKLGYDIQMIDMGIALAHYNLIRTQNRLIEFVANIGEMAQSLNVIIADKGEHEKAYKTHKKETVRVEYVFTVAGL
jgi:nitroreductase